VAGEITANRPPVQHCGNHTFREGDLPAALDRAFNGACPNSPAADRQTPAGNAGTSIGATFARARSKSAPAFPSMKIHGAGLAVSADFQAWRDERDWTAEICDVGNRGKDAVAETQLLEEIPVRRDD
jgi:hypothetical protein